jgi:hypothetical protein
MDKSVGGIIGDTTVYAPMRTRKHISRTVDHRIDGEGRRLSCVQRCDHIIRDSDDLGLAYPRGDSDIAGGIGGVAAYGLRAKGSLTLATLEWAGLLDVEPNHALALGEEKEAISLIDRDQVARFWE